MSPKQSDDGFTQTDPDAAPSGRCDRPIDTTDLAALEGAPSQIAHRNPIPVIQPTMMMQPMMIGPLLFKPIKGRPNAGSKSSKRRLSRFLQRTRQTEQKTRLWPAAEKNVDPLNPLRLPRAVRPMMVQLRKSCRHILVCV